MQKRDASWLGLLAYCVTITLAAGLVFAVLFAGASLALAFGQTIDSSPVKAQVSSANPTYAGVVTDSECGARHIRDSRKSPAECVRMCISHGAKYMLVSGDTAYVLAGGDGPTIDRAAGQRVRVQGTLAGDTLRVSSVEVEPETP